MTRKDYELIALTIKRAFPPGGAEDDKSRRQIAFQFAFELGRENPRFDRDRFLAACGVP